MARKESVALEHSEPGTNPIVPRYLNSTDDRAVVSGSRRDSPPAAYESNDEEWIRKYLAEGGE